MIEKKKRKKEEKEKPITSTVWAKALTEHEHDKKASRGGAEAQRAQRN
jgi:hypothetical protein